MFFLQTHICPQFYFAIGKIGVDRKQILSSTLFRHRTKRAVTGMGRNTDEKRVRQKTLQIEIGKRCERVQWPA